jgi:hypothetical protein
MRLVIKYTAGDGCTWWCDDVSPVEYESAEQLYVDFETAARASYAAKVYVFVVADREFETGYFFLEDGTYNPPEILTVDEWFARSSPT